MARDEEVANLAGSLEQTSRNFERAEAHRSASATLIASAEYELEQVKKSFLGAKLVSGPDGEASIPAAPPVDLAARRRRLENKLEGKQRLRSA